MNTDLDQWLVKPQTGNDHLAAFKKMTISTREPLLRLPSILTSDNAATWLATRKGAKDENQFFIKSQITKLSQEDNAKWLLRPETEKNKMETDLVVISEELSPWLAGSVMTTSLKNLPGKRSNENLTLPAQLSNKTNLDNWLWKPAPLRNESLVSKDLEEWLLVPRPSSQNFKSSDNPLGDWETKSLACSWISPEDDKVQEWLKNALDDDEDDDFDECSIEVISQNE